MTNTEEMIYRATAAHHLEPYFTKESIANWIVTGNESLLEVKIDKQVRMTTSILSNISSADIIKAVEESKASSNRGTDPKWKAL